MIQSFMDRHARMSGADHPLATRCEDCAFHLTESPTADPDVPHCQWAARRRRIAFMKRVPVDGQGSEIPVCRQFQSAQSGDDVIPEHPAPPSGVTRDWIVEMMKAMAQMVEVKKPQQADIRLVCERLTGRPMKVSETHKGWFADQLDDEVGNLSDGQLWTLYLWVSGDWRFDKTHRYRLLLPSGQLLPYTDEEWSPETDRALVDILDTDEVEVDVKAETEVIDNE